MLFRRIVDKIKENRRSTQFDDIRDIDEDLGRSQMNDFIGSRREDSNISIFESVNAFGEPESVIYVGEEESVQRQPLRPYHINNTQQSNNANINKDGSSLNKRKTVPPTKEESPPLKRYVPPISLTSNKENTVNVSYEAKCGYFDNNDQISKTCISQNVNKQCDVRFETSRGDRSSRLNTARSDYSTNVNTAPKGTFIDEDAPMSHSLHDAPDVDAVFSKVRHNHIDGFRAALSQGFDIQSVDRNGNTVLHLCAQNNLRKMASLAIKSGCPKNGINNKGMSPLDYAELYRFDNLAEYLAEKGCRHGIATSSAASMQR